MIAFILFSPYPLYSLLHIGDEKKYIYFEHFYCDHLKVILIHSTEVNNWKENQRIIFSILIFYYFSINVQLNTIYLIFIHIFGSIFSYLITEGPTPD